MGISIYRQIQAQHDWQQRWAVIKVSLTDSDSWRLYLAIALMFLNWGLESKKWQILLKHVTRISFTKAYKSVLGGVAFTMITPNRMGEFIGRVFYVEDGQRIRAATLTIVGSISQMIMTLLAGVIGLTVLRHAIIGSSGAHGLSFYWVYGLLWGTVFVLILMALFYFRIDLLVRVAEKIKSFKQYIYFIELLDDFKNRELVTILVLSAVRFCVFISQYMLLFALFDVDIPLWQGCCAVGVLLLLLAVIPMPGLAELGIRGQASVVLFTIFSNNPVGILATTGSVWLINIILPALLGSLLILNVKLFTKKEESV